MKSFRTKKEKDTFKIIFRYVNTSVSLTDRMTGERIKM